MSWALTTRLELMLGSTPTWSELAGTRSGTRSLRRNHHPHESSQPQKLQRIRMLRSEPTASLAN